MTNTVQSQKWARLDQNGEITDTGRIFTNGRTVHDMGNVAILGHGVDTVRQLYSGSIKKTIMDELESMLGKFILINDVDFAVTKMGKRGGYRYGLQNREQGVMILLGSFYHDPEQEAGHLKIELSPQLTYGVAPNIIQGFLDDLASSILNGWRHSGVAVHVAIDFTGYGFRPDDFFDNLSTRSRRLMRADAVDDFEVTPSDVAFRYGRTDTVMIGRADSLQLCAYRKDLKAQKDGSAAYWAGLWKGDADGPVWRIEYRFHHRVIRELGNSQGKVWTCYADLAAHFKTLLNYGLHTHRYKLGKLMHPLWQMFLDDIEWSGDIILRVKRERITGRNPEKIAAGFLGYYLTGIYHQYGSQIDPGLVLFELKQTDLWPFIEREYMNKKGYDDELMEMKIAQGLDERSVGRVA